MWPSCRQLPVTILHWVRLGVQQLLGGCWVLQCCGWLPVYCLLRLETQPYWVYPNTSKQLHPELGKESTIWSSLPLHDFKNLKSMSGTVLIGTLYLPYLLTVWDPSNTDFQETELWWNRKDKVIPFFLQFKTLSLLISLELKMSNLPHSEPLEKKDPGLHLGEVIGFF